MSKGEKRRDPAAGGAPESPTLGDAAAALDDALRRFDDLTAAAKRIPLNSQKSIDRAAKTMNEAAESQVKVDGHLRALVDAITAARLRHEATAVVASEHAQEIQRRANEFGALLERFAALGQDAAGINGVMQQAGPLRGDTLTPDRIDAAVALIEDAKARMDRVVAGATELSEAADAAGMVDLARQAESLRQQILSARNKVKLLEQGLASKVPPRGAA